MGLLGCLTIALSHRPPYIVTMVLSRAINHDIVTIFHVNLVLRENSTKTKGKAEEEENGRRLWR